MATPFSTVDPFHGIDITKPAWKPFGPSTEAWTGSQSRTTPGVMRPQSQPVSVQKPAPKSVGVPFPHPDKVTPIQVQPPVVAQSVAPATPWQWHAGQTPQWPIKPPPQGAMPFEAAQLLQDRELAKRYPAVESNYIPPNYNVQLQGGFAPTPGSQEYGDYIEQSPEATALGKEKANARTDLFKQYHSGWSPGEYAALQRQQNQIGVPVLRGNAGGFGGESIAERDDRLRRENAAIGIEQQKANAANLNAQAGMTQAQAAAKEAETRDPRLLPEYLAKNPEQALLYGAMRGVKPDDLAALRSFNTGPIGPANYSQKLQAYPDLARLLARPDLKLHEKLGLLSTTPGAEDPNHPVNQIISSWLKEQMASGDFTRDLETEYPQHNPYDIAQWFSPTKRSILAQVMKRFGHELPTTE